jgi:hypothetical protein
MSTGVALLTGSRVSTENPHVLCWWPAAAIACRHGSFVAETSLAHAVTRPLHQKNPYRLLEAHATQLFNSQEDETFCVG